MEPSFLSPEPCAAWARHEFFCSEETVTTAQTHCRQCGTCCRKGGPALHRDDLELIRQGHFSHHQLMTLRRGEPAFSPVDGRLEPTRRELVKINGHGREWVCLFFQPKTARCAIYAHRPLECRLLKCWAPEALLAVVEQDTITRRDLLNPNDPVLELIALHDQQCPAEAVAEAVADWRQKPDESRHRAALVDLVRRDLAVRHHALTEFGLPPAVEFFVFGRPLFKLLGGYGVTTSEAAGTVELRWPGE